MRKWLYLDYFRTKRQRPSGVPPHLAHLVPSLEYVTLEEVQHITDQLRVHHNQPHFYHEKEEKPKYVKTRPHSYHHGDPHYPHYNGVNDRIQDDYDDIMQLLDLQKGKTEKEDTNRYGHYLTLLLSFFGFLKQLLWRIEGLLELSWLPSIALDLHI